MDYPEYSEHKELDPGVDEDELEDEDAEYAARGGDRNGT